MKNTDRVEVAAAYLVVFSPLLLMRETLCLAEPEGPPHSKFRISMEFSRIINLNLNIRMRAFSTECNKINLWLNFNRKNYLNFKDDNVDQYYQE